MIKKTLGAVAVAALLATSARAQTQDHVMSEGPHAPLMHRQEIGLNADQVARLEAIQARLQSTQAEQCRQLEAATTDEAKARLRGSMQGTMQGAHIAAAAVLTTEQRARLDSLHAAHHGGQAGAAHAQHGAQAGAGHAQHGAGHAQQSGDGSVRTRHAAGGQFDVTQAAQCGKAGGAAGHHGAHGQQGGHNH